MDWIRSGPLKRQAVGDFQGSFPGLEPWRVSQSSVINSDPSWFVWPGIGLLVARTSCPCSRAWARALALAYWTGQAARHSTAPVCCQWPPNQKLLRLWEAARLTTWGCYCKLPLLLASHSPITRAVCKAATRGPLASAAATNLSTATIPSLSWQGRRCCCWSLAVRHHRGTGWHRAGVTPQASHFIPSYQRFLS